MARLHTSDCMARFLLVIAAGACCGAEAGGADTRDVHNAYGTIFSAGNGTGCVSPPSPTRARLSIPERI